MKRKKKSGSGGANWMDTYGDMVTLLLCFFVMLYSMSALDQSRWIALVQSLNPSEANTEEQSSLVIGEEITDEAQGEATVSGMTQEEVDESLEGIYLALSQYAENAGLQDKVSVSQGSGYVFISFDDTVFFDGDSYTLKAEGKAVLDQIAEPIAEARDSINEIRVLGHTAQADPGRPNYVNADRFLASNRATVVTIYLQEKNVIDPARLVSVGYGQWRPVADNDTVEGRAENRRVELIISGMEVDDSDSDSITQYYTMRDEAQSENTGETTTGQENLPE